MRLSESTKKVPETTIRSPGMSPFVTSTSSPSAPPRLDQPRLEVAVAAVDEHRFAQPRVHDRIRRHDERRREVDRELHVDEHAGLERPLRVRRLEPHLQRQRRLVEDRFRRTHRRRQCAALSRRGDPRGGAAADERQLVAVHVGQNPHAVEIRDPVELEAAIEPEAGRDAALQHDAVHRRLHADVLARARGDWPSPAAASWRRPWSAARRPSGRSPRRARRRATATAAAAAAAAA